MRNFLATHDKVEISFGDCQGAQEPPGVIGSAGQIEATRPRKRGTPTNQTAVEHAFEVRMRSRRRSSAFTRSHLCFGLLTGTSNHTQ